MALQKQTVRMSVVDGLDTKTDEKNVIATRFVEAQNVVYTKTGSVSKRLGYDQLTAATTTGTLPEINAVTTFGTELLGYSNNDLYTYSEALQKWMSKGTTASAILSTAAINNTSYKLTKPSVAISDNIAVYAYEETITPTTSVRYTITDNVTGTTIFSGTFAGDTPKVVSVRGRFFIFFINSGEVYHRYINISTPTTISTAVLVSPIAAATYDVMATASRAYFAIPASSTILNIGFFDVDGNISGPFTVTTTTVADVVSIAEEYTGLIRLCYGTVAATSMKVGLYVADLVSTLHSTATVSLGSGLVSVSSANKGTKSTIFVSVASLGTTPASVKSIDFDSTGALTTLTVVQNGARLQSKAKVFNNTAYFLICHSGNTGYDNMDTLFLLSDSAQFLCKIEPDAVPRLTTAFLPELLAVGSTLVTTAAIIAEAQVPGSTTTVATTVKKLIMDFSPISNFFDAALGENLHITGGILKAYDGAVAVEHGFLDTPPAPTLTSESSVGGILPSPTSGTAVYPSVFQYLVVYAWKDKSGQLHRSAPSLPLTYTVSAAPKKTPTIRYYPLFFTQKENVEVEIYRTEANGTTFYKLKQAYTDIKMNNKAVAYAEFPDSLDDATLIANEVLYTTGGTLENVSCDASKYVATYKNRVFAMSADGTYLHYSKTREQNGPVEFAAELKIKLDSYGGPGTALIKMDDHLVIFKESAFFTISGEGPNNLGEQDDFRQPQLVTSDVGCTELNSVVSLPTGIMFKSAKGIYMLGRDFNLRYIGAPVEAYNGLTITSATLITNTNEVRFTTSDSTGLTLVYDYFHQRWSTFENITAVDACIYNNKFTYARNSGDVLLESANYSDNGSFIPMKLVSAWITLGAEGSNTTMSAIQGFERFYKFLLLGSYRSNCKFKVSFGFDYDDSWTSEVIVDAGSILATPVYGDGNYGTTTPYGGADPLFQWRIFPKRQKCESFRFKIEDINSGTAGASFSLSNFAAEIGIKPTLYKRGNSHSAGTT